MCGLQASIDKETQKNIDDWLNNSYDEESKATIRQMQQNNPQELINAFYKKLEFGTGGLRGVMGIGSNRMNVYTVRAATQGFANYLKMQFSNKKISVLIGYDSRHHSANFANEAALVLAGNDIEVFLYKNLRPVPLVSFGLLYKKCDAGIMITASHNPPEYNGYKAYWNNGAQVLPPHDSGIINEVNKITNPQMVNIASKTTPLIKIIDEEIDLAYLDAIRSLQFKLTTNKEKGKNLKIIYTPLHGAGITMVPKALADWGFTNYLVVKAQEKPDGNFPTVETPNPEERSALKLGIEVLQKEKGDILIGTDPDTDRMGVVAMHHNEPFLFNGNQIACLCLEHICQSFEKTQRPPKAIFIKTIVTSELFKAICDYYNYPCLDVLTGFKYIGEKIDLWSKDSNGNQFIFGGEESYGYLLGTHSRDKDAVISANLIAEVALQAKLKSKTLVDFLNDIYKKYGLFQEKLQSLTLKGKQGAEQIQKIMTSFRKNPPREFNHVTVTKFEDYQNQTSINFLDQTKKTIYLPKSNVLRFWLSDETKIVIRPSGTEPKIKLYCGIRKNISTDIEQTTKECDLLLNQYLEAIKGLLNTY